MSTINSIKFNDVPSKRNTRAGTKKRVAFEGKEIVVENQKHQKKADRDGKLDDRENGTKSVQNWTPLDDDADNQGFTVWLRSGNGVDTMRLFVIANSLLVFVTMAWPHIQETFVIMLQLIFGERILGWYSTNLWIMIDSHFKDQFQRYLEEEYQRNPKMREDVQMHVAVDKVDKPNTDAHETYEFLESCGAEICSIGQTDLALAPTQNLAAGVGERDQEENKIEEREKEDVDLAPFRKFYEDRDAKPPDDREELPSIAKEIRDEVDLSEMKGIEELSTFQQEQHVARNEKDKGALQQQQPKLRIRKKWRWYSGLRIGAKSEQDAKRKKKINEAINTLTFTDDDFDSVTRKRRLTGEHDNRDFAEFHDEDNRALESEEEDVDTSIFLADLPYKPLIDVYDLQRISREEFCPLALDDDSSCEETQAWP